MTAPLGRTTRAQMVARVRAALGPDGHRTPHGALAIEPVARLCSHGPAIVATFLERATAAGMTTRRCGASRLAAVLAELLRQSGARRVAVGVASDALRDAAEQAVTLAGATRAAGADPFDTDAGVTDVDAAVAETGSFAISSGPRRPRTVYLAPPVHIALVPASRVVPDLVDFCSAAAPGGAASHVLVSGPSKTADIEGVLVTGVHGPGVVWIVLVEDV